MEIRDEYTYFNLFKIEDRLGKTWVDEYLDLKVERQRVRVLTCVTKPFNVNDDTIKVRFIVQIYETMVSIGTDDGVSYSIDKELCLVVKKGYLFLGVLNEGNH